MTRPHSPALGMPPSEGGRVSTAGGLAVFARWLRRSAASIGDGACRGQPQRIVSRTVVWRVLLASAGSATVCGLGLTSRPAI